jgi:hypothetical protein
MNKWPLARPRTKGDPKLHRIYKTILKERTQQEREVHAVHASPAHSLMLIIVILRLKTNEIICQKEEL